MHVSGSAEKDRLRLLTRVSRLYHEQGVRQPEIALRLGLSQGHVSRLLKEATQRGIVRIIVVPPDQVHSDVEEQLVLKYGLRDAVVVDVVSDSNSTPAGLGGAAGAYLDSVLQRGDVIGISSWSATLLASVDRMQMRRPVGVDLVVQTVGGVGSPDAQMEATRLTGGWAARTGATPLFVPAPGLVGSGSLREALFEDDGMSPVLTAWSAITVSLVGIGTLKPSSLLRRSGNSLPEADQVKLEEAGAVGDVCLRYFDRDGRPVVTGLDERIVGIDRPALLRIPRRLGVAGGEDKIQAIRAAILGSWINILVTDLLAALALLEA